MCKAIDKIQFTSDQSYSEKKIFKTFSFKKSFSNDDKFL
jgi:hypothetical protein